MNRGLVFALLLLVGVLGCGSPGSGALFQGQSTGSDSGGGSSDGGSGTASGGSGSSTNSGGTGASSGSSGGTGTSSGGTGGGSSSTNSGGGGNCVPNGCPSAQYCGSWNDGCGNTIDCDVCSSGDTCGSDHACHPCTPTQTPAVVCQDNNCGHYMDDCGNLQTCVPSPDDGMGGCSGYLFCTTGDIPWVPYAMPNPDWTDVGVCKGCVRDAGMDGLCGTSGDAYACPADFADNIQDDTETDIDCGGFNPSKCEVGQACLENSDCLEDRCISGVCAHTSFSNPGCLNLKQIWSGKDIMCCP